MFKFFFIISKSIFVVLLCDKDKKTIYLSLLNLKITNNQISILLEIGEIWMKNKNIFILFEWTIP